MENSRKFRENDFDENDSFHRKLRKIISKHNHHKINKKMLRRTISNQSGLDYTFGSYSTKWDTLRHPSSPHAIR